MQTNKPLAILIMGVSGSGKTTVGKKLSAKTGIPFFDADDYHSPANKAKMAAGIPLTDEDRKDWLSQLNNLAVEHLKTGSCIIACSALKRAYRKVLSSKIEISIRFVHLYGSIERIQQRMGGRSGHFMPVSLLETQFNDLEYPKEAFNISIENNIETIVAEIENELFHKAAFGIIGLGVMGKSLARNLASKGFSLSMYNRHVKGSEEHVAKNFKNQYPELQASLPFDNISEFVNSLQSPKKIMLMVNAGNPVDAVLSELLPLLNENDVVIDGGNSHYLDTQKRAKETQKNGVYFMGCGVSGGEEGALKGPSLMPGGNLEAYSLVKVFLENMAAKDASGKPCCNWIGPEGSGHFVKMVHNGLEYAEMQLLAEVYHIFSACGKKPDEIAGILSRWKNGTLDSYLLEITIDILNKKDGNGEAWLIDKILDEAQNKGTGNWTTVAITHLGLPATMIATALFARYISSFKSLRVTTAEKLGSGDVSFSVDEQEVENAFSLARLLNHHQGFWLLQTASTEFNWNLNISEIARIWTNGCIIRSTLMEELSEVLESDENILLTSFASETIKDNRSNLLSLVSKAIKSGLPLPCFTEAATFLNSITTSQLPANLIQAQRDYFGAHTYKRTDDPEGKHYHTHWKP